MTGNTLRFGLLIVITLECPELEGSHWDHWVHKDHGDPVSLVLPLGCRGLAPSFHNCFTGRHPRSAALPCCCRGRRARVLLQRGRTAPRTAEPALPDCAPTQREQWQERPPHRFGLDGAQQLAVQRVSPTVLLNGPTKAAQPLSSTNVLHF